jgi:hypothetical protein
MRLFFNADGVVNYGLLPLELLGATIVVVSEMKSNKVPVE